MIFPINRPILKSILIIAFFLCQASFVYAQEGKTKHYNVSRDGVMINGYDLVSYFLGTVTKGKEENKVIHSGVEYWFANPVVSVPVGG